MNRLAIRLIRLVLATSWAALGSQAILAQSNQTILTPPVPLLHSPVESFRALLAMPSADRRQWIATRNTNVQEQLLLKIHEYTKLTPEEREWRLKATELRWYLEPLMHSPATNRTGQLALIPEAMRGMVAVRLEQWDRIPSPVQQLFLTNDQGAGYFARVAVPTNYPSLPTPQLRRSLAAHINQLFDLTPAEKERVLATLSDAERQQMERTFAAFQKLSTDQRRQCLLSFKLFTSMTLAERQEFLKNAERWSLLSPAERQSWRELVSAAPHLPPLPNTRVATPPIPLSPRKPVAAMATNGG